MRLLTLVDVNGNWAGINVDHISNIHATIRGDENKVFVRVNAKVYSFYMTYQRLLEEIKNTEDI